MERHANADPYKTADAASTEKVEGMTLEFYLTFDGFDDNELERIQNIIRAFSGYKSHRPITETMRHAEYNYEYTEEVAKLTRNLRKMVKFMDVEARVACSGNKCSVEKF